MPKFDAALLITTISGRSSLLKSPRTISEETAPSRNLICHAKVPLPKSRNTLISKLFALITTISARLSLLKSPTTTLNGYGLHEFRPESKFRSPTKDSLVYEHNVVHTNGKHIAFDTQHELRTHTDIFITH